MSRTLTVAAIQMDANHRPTQDRLSHASEHIATAAKEQAQLVVLPELFNTGYTYSEELYEATEPWHGTTVSWMKAQAESQNLYIAGSLLLVEGDHTYNTAVLVAPDGNTWRYDKLYPMAWERSLFREGRAITIAQTKLGRIGMMIGWDAAHAELWNRYAGLVDLMLIIDSPLDWQDAKLGLPQQKTVSFSNLRFQPAWSSSANLNSFRNWLNVPVVRSSGCGQLETPLPAPLISFGVLTQRRPDLWLQPPIAVPLQFCTQFTPMTSIYTPDEAVIAQSSGANDEIVVAAIKLSTTPPLPTIESPPQAIIREEGIYADTVLPMLMTLIYRRGLRRQWGGKMAPTDTQTTRWLWVALGLFILGLVMGLSTGQNKKS